MPMVRLRADILRADRATADRWYVTNGATAVGPVALELVERGIEAGKIPVESYIRHEMWKIWRPLSELCITQETKPIDPNGTPVIPIVIPLPSDSGDFDPRRTTMKPAMSAPAPLPDLRLPPDTDPDFAPSSTRPPMSSRQPMSTPQPLNQPQPANQAQPMSARQPANQAQPMSTRQPANQAQPMSTRQPANQAQPMSARQPPPPPQPMSARQPMSAPIPPILALEEVEEVEPDADSLDLEPVQVPLLFVPSAPPSVEDITLPTLLPRPNEKMTADPSNVTAQLKDALLTLSGVILREVGCEGVMVHRVDDEGAVAVVAHGPRMFDVLGLRTRLLDPAIVAAAAGILVVAEPTPGPAGQAVLSRLEKLGVLGTGAAMIPIRLKGRLFGTVEMGQAAAFDGAALAKAEGYVRVVQAKMEAADWKLDG
jgi:hypothetical protein